MSCHVRNFLRSDSVSVRAPIISLRTLIQRLVDKPTPVGRRVRWIHTRRTTGSRRWQYRDLLFEASDRSFWHPFDQSLREIVLRFTPVDVSSKSRKSIRLRRLFHYLWLSRSSRNVAQWSVNIAIKQLDVWHGDCRWDECMVWHPADGLWEGHPQPSTGHVVVVFSTSDDLMSFRLVRHVGATKGCDLEMYLFYNFNWNGLKLLRNVHICRHTFERDDSSGCDGVKIKLYYS